MKRSIKTSKCKTARVKNSTHKTITIWNFDPNDPACIAEARRQSLLASQAPEEQETISFIEAVCDFSDWT